MQINFITGNQNKFLEVKKLIPNIKRVELDLPEIQELDLKKIIKEKLKSAKKQIKGPIVCEDVSLEINALNKFPGPLVKWFLKKISNDEIYKLIKNYEDNSVNIICLVGFFDGKKDYYFKGEIKAKIVKPRGENGFGFDPIIIPLTSSKTFAEMSKQEKNLLSHRYKAFKKLKEHLEK